MLLKIYDALFKSIHEEKGMVSKETSLSHATQRGRKLSPLLLYLSFLLKMCMFNAHVLSPKEKGKLCVTYILGEEWYVMLPHKEEGKALFLQILSENSMLCHLTK